MNLLKSKILLILFIISFFSSASAENINLKNIESDDTYVYSYFNLFLKDYESTVNKIIQNNISYINDSESIYKETKGLNNEIILYEEYGVESPIKDVISPFYEFSKNLEELSHLNKEFSKNIELNTTNSKYFAKITATKMITKIGEMKENLKNIENSSSLQKENEILEFDTSKVKKSLNYLELKLNNNLEKIGDISPNSNLTIFISPENPKIFENVSIYGTGLNGNGKIVIIGPENITENVILTNNYYSKTYYFKKTGIYKLKLTQYGKESEILIINVSKIPTEIIMDENYQLPILKNTELSGKIIDFYGNTVSFGHVLFENQSLSLEKGIFEKELYSKYQNVSQYVIIFEENEKYLPSEKIVQINFTKMPLDIQINSEKGVINENEPLIIIGSYSETENLNLKLWVNDKINDSFYLNNHFEKNITFKKSRTYKIYVTYGGNEVYDFSKSNVIIVKVKPKNNDFLSPFRNSYLKNFFNLGILPIICVIIVIVSIAQKLLKKRENKGRIISNEVKEIENLIETNVEITITREKTIISGYVELYDKIIKKYNIKSNLTPNELLKHVRKINLDIYYDLKAVTKIHERTVYGKENFDENTIKNFFNLIETILEKL